MNLTISTENIWESKRLILLLIISMAIALQEEAVSIEEAENLLFSPYTSNRIESLGFEDDILRIINLGCELENVKSLIPHALNSSINEIFTLSLNKLKSLPAVKIPSKKWVDSSNC